MTIKITKWVNPMLLLLTIGLAYPSAQAAHYHFSQEGYHSKGLESDGSYHGNKGRIYGEFEGNDVLDGSLQVKNISLHFAGNPFFNFLDKESRKPEFYLGNFDISYNVATKTLAYVGEISLSELKSYDKEFKTLSHNGLFNLNPLPEGLINMSNDQQPGKAGSISQAWNVIVNSDDDLPKIKNLDSIQYETSQPITVNEVPLPGALGLFLVSLSWLGIFGRKRLSLKLMESQ